jgi:hypothetical protein
VQEDVRVLLRAAVIAILAVGIWVFARYGSAMPEPQPASAAAQGFSAARAEATLARILGPEKPHPASSEENAAVRERILREYASLGVPTTTYRALGCNLGRRSVGFLACATITDIIADVRPGRGKAIVMLSHIDSVPAGPGAADDESGTASILESVRALRTSPDAGLHPIIAVNTDGEEFGLLGAASFLDNPELKARVGAVVNVEARGNAGPSLLFQMSPGDGPLLDVYCRSVHTYATSSLTSVIYKFLPNDTDLTLFIRAGFPSWNFAFSDNVAHYHTPLDTRAHLSQSSLQMQGENMLGMVRGLERKRYENLRGQDAIYISVFGRWLPRMPASWAAPAAAVTLVLLLVAAFLPSVEKTSVGGWVAGFFVVPVLVVAAVVTGYILHPLAAIVSGHSDPSFAYPLLLRISLALGLLSVVLLVSRMAGPRASAIGIWVWMAVLALVTALLVTGFSPYFLFPTLIAGPLVLLAALIRLPVRGVAWQFLAFVAALPALVLWTSLVSTAETIQGLLLHPVFTVPAALGLAAAIPFIAARDMSMRAWLSVCGITAMIAVALAIAAGSQPAFSEISPQRLSISYVEDASTHRTFWAADAGGFFGSAPLPPTLRAAAKFSDKPERPYPFSFGLAYIAPAGTTRFESPSALANVSETGAGTRRIALTLHGSPQADQMVIAVPKESGLKTIEIDGKRFDVPKTWAHSSLPYNFIGCFTRDCATKTIQLGVSARGPLKFLVSEVRYGLPPDGQKLIAARPKTAVASQNGDTTVLINSMTVPAG